MIRIAYPFLVLSTAAAILSGCSSQKTAETLPSDTLSAVPSGPVTIVPADKGPDISGVQLAILSPKPDEVVKTDSLVVKVDLKGYDVASPSPGEQSKGIAFSK